MDNFNMFFTKMKKKYISIPISSRDKNYLMAKDMLRFFTFSFHLVALVLKMAAE
jgi:hypothetical protein